MAEVWPATLSGSACRGITVDTGIAISGPGRMPIFLGPTVPQPRWKRSSTTCPSALVFRKAVLWHEGQQHVFRNLQEKNRNADEFAWNFHCSSRDGARLEAAFDGAGSCLHRLPYLKTNCSGSFEVTNNSLAKASVRLERGFRQMGGAPTQLETATGAVLEMVGR